MIDLSTAVACRIVTPAEADAIEGAVIDHGNGATELRLHDLTDDQKDALDRYLVWREQQGNEACNGG